MSRLQFGLIVVTLAHSDLCIKQTDYQMMDGYEYTEAKV